MAGKMTDRLDEMVERQAAFQKRIGLFNGEDPEKETKELLLSIHKKTGDVLDGLAWKLHRKSGVIPDRDNIQDQIIDLLKFLFILANEWGMDSDEIFEWFIKKSDYVEARYDREFSLELSDAACVVVDIDGVLCDYRGGWKDYVLERGFEHTDVPETLDLSMTLRNPQAYDVLKSEFRRSGAKRRLEAMEGASAFTKSLKSIGKTVVIVTARPIHEHINIYYDTIAWLEANEIKYDHIVFEEKKREWVGANLSKVEFCVEDDPSQATRMAAWGMKVYLVDASYNKNVEADGIIRVQNLMEIQQRLKDEEGEAS